MIRRLASRLRPVAGFLQALAVLLAVLSVVAHPVSMAHAGGANGTMICTGNGFIAIDAAGNEVPVDGRQCPMCKTGCDCCLPGLAKLVVPSPPVFAAPTRLAARVLTSSSAPDISGGIARTGTIRAPPVLL